MYNQSAQQHIFNLKNIGGIIHTIGVPIWQQPTRRHFYHFNNWIFFLENLVEN